MKTLGDQSETLMVVPLLENQLETVERNLALIPPVRGPPNPSGYFRQPSRLGPGFPETLVSGRDPSLRGDRLPILCETGLTNLRFLFKNLIFFKCGQRPIHTSHPTTETVWIPHSPGALGSFKQFSRKQFKRQKTQATISLFSSPSNTKSLSSELFVFPPLILGV